MSMSDLSVDNVACLADKNLQNLISKCSAARCAMVARHVVAQHVRQLNDETN